MRRIQFLKRLFHIQPGNGKANGDVLLCELSHHHVCLATASSQSKQITSLSYFESVLPISANNLSATLQQLPASGYEKIVVSSAFPEVVLLPEHLFAKKKAADLLQLKEEPLKDPVFYNILDEQNVVVVFAIPRQIQERLDAGKASEKMHVYTCQLKQHTAVAPDQLFVHFESREFRVLAKKEEQLLLAQTYAYAAPLDVVYFLLAICKEFDLSQSLTAVVLSGLVDEDSALYKELNQYFAMIRFAEEDAAAMQEHQFPKHFFSSMHKLAACAL